VQLLLQHGLVVSHLLQRSAQVVVFSLLTEAIGQTASRVLDAVLGSGNLTMDAAVDAVFPPPSKGSKETGPVPHRISETEHRAGAIQISAEGLACTKAICNYIHETYGRFPGGTDAMHLMWVMQAHHIDTDYYDRFFGPGAYGPAHAAHLATWHP
jgi:hypothetical protein